MFDSLTRRFEDVFSRLRGQGRLTEADINQAATEIRQALLEADVNLAVVDSFIERIRHRCTAAEVSASLTPGQQVIKVVNEELQTTLGGQTLSLTFAATPPTIVLLAGLQGAGKTTAAVKLAQWFKTQGRNPLIVGADLQRPAAVEQLRVLAERIDVPVYSADGLTPAPTSPAAATDTAPAEPTSRKAKRRANQPKDPVATAAAGLAQARQLGRDVLIVDTAGRLAVDSDLMTQVAHVSDAVSPHYTFYVLDAMAGQDAVTTAGVFNATLAIDAVILTKLDGDARSGAALSVSEVLGCPIAFSSVGEGIDEFEQFHPDRMATRILGMGDVTSLIEKAESVYEAEEAELSAQRLLDGSFTLDDFVEQLRQVRKMGNLKSLVAMMPGVPAELRDADIDDGRIDKAEAIVLSMTPAERLQPDIIDASRRSRIATGSGTSSTQVATMLKQFSQMKKMMSSQLSKFGGGGTPAKRNKKQAKRKPAKKPTGNPAAGNRAAGNRAAASRVSSRTGGRPSGRPSGRPNTRPNGRSLPAATPGSANPSANDPAADLLADLDITLPEGLQQPGRR